MTPPTPPPNGVTELVELARRFIREGQNQPGGRFALLAVLSGLEYLAEAVEELNKKVESNK
jgi:hypothetical protein